MHLKQKNLIGKMASTEKCRHGIDYYSEGIDFSGVEKWVFIISDPASVVNLSSLVSNEQNGEKNHVFGFSG